jgi:hypothetical protein
MEMNIKSKLLAVALLAGSSLFAGPRVVVGFGVGVGYPYGYYAPAPPPVPVVPYVAPYPGLGYTWVGGYWYPAGGRYLWHAGYWAHPPFYGARWVAPRYYGHRYYGGYWGRGYR